MTYQKLGQIINEMSSDQRNMDVTVWLANVDEFYPVEDVEMVDGEKHQEDRLDDRHPVLIVLR